MPKAKRIRIEVVPARVWVWETAEPRKGWAVWVDRAIDNATWHKVTAVANARVIAERIMLYGGTAELCIRNRAGRIVDRRTYPRSSDPRRSRG